MAFHERLGETLITPSLGARTGRMPDLGAEAEVLWTMGRHMAEQPEGLLSALVDALLNLCSGHSAGITVVEREEGSLLLRTVAAGGHLAGLNGTVLDAERWPCGYCLSQNEPQLFHLPGRYFPVLANQDPPVQELLSLPLVSRDGPVGTLWLASHSGQELDAEDLRIMSGLAGFTFSAMRQAGLFQDLAVARREAHELGQRLGVLLESISDGLAFLDEKLCFLFANGECLDLIQKPDTEVVGFPVRQVFPPEWAGSLQEVLEKAVRDKQHQVFECHLKEGDRLLELNIYPAKTEGLCLLVTDISGRRRQELERTALFKSTQAYAEKLRGLAAAAQAISSATNLRSTLQEITNYAAKVIGAHQSLTAIHFGNDWSTALTAEFLSEKYQDWKSRGVRDGSYGMFAAVSEVNRPMRFDEDELQTLPAGQRLAAHCASRPPMRGWLAVPLTRKDGSNLGTIQLSDKLEGEFTQEDESILIQLGHLASSAAEKAWAEEALRDSRQRLEIAVEAGRLGIFEVDLRDRNLACSGTFRQNLGLPAAGTIGIDDAVSHLHAEDRTHVRQAFRHAVKNRDRYEVECRCVWAGGTLHWLAVFGRILQDERGRPARIIGVVSDVTQRKQIEEELRSINQTLEQRVEKRTAVANRRADQLSALALQLTRAEQKERRRIAQVLHDHLQQILVAAKLRLGMAKEQAVAEGQKEALLQVADLLNRAIEASRDLTVDLAPPILFDGGLAAGLEWLSRRMKDEQAIEVHLQAHGREEVDTYMKAFLFQTTRELLFNVVKHSGVGEAWVRMEVGEEGDVRIEVRDEGKGFFVSDIDPRKGGGFGLSSLRERIGLLGGRLNIRSRPQEGTTITLIAPKAKGGEEELAARQDLMDILRPEERAGGSGTARRGAAPEDRPLRVLLADDHKILREGLVSLLEEQPGVHVVGEASDGQMAVELALREKPDVIIMDITMPRLNGIEATRQIVAQWPQAIVIGLSMHDKEDMANAITEAGARAYVTKGAPSDILVETIWSHAPFQRTHQQLARKTG